MKWNERTVTSSATEKCDVLSFGLFSTTFLFFCVGHFMVERKWNTRKMRAKVFANWNALSHTPILNFWLALSVDITTSLFSKLLIIYRVLNTKSCQDLKWSGWWCHLKLQNSILSELNLSLSLSLSFVVFFFIGKNQKTIFIYLQQQAVYTTAKALCGVYGVCVRVCVCMPNHQRFITSIRLHLNLEKDWS